MSVALMAFSHAITCSGASPAALAAIPLLALTACSQMGPAPKAGPAGVARGASLQQCETLAASFRHDQTSLDSATVQAAGALKLAERTIQEQRANGAWALINQLHNQRMKTELGLRLRYPTVADGLRA